MRIHRRNTDSMATSGGAALIKHCRGQADHAPSHIEQSGNAPERAADVDVEHVAYQQTQMHFAHMRGEAGDDLDEVGTELAGIIYLPVQYAIKRSTQHDTIGTTPS